MSVPERVPERVLPERASALLDFWFGPPSDPEREQRRKIWFESTEEFDAALRRAFLADYEAAANGGLAAWEETAEGALALVLLLDQVPRNIFRETPRAYASDALARQVADRALERGFDQQLPTGWRLFFYMPFHHSEDLADQERSLELFGSLPRNPDGRGALRRYGHPYVEVIARFGRFPHRNAILGRQSSVEEIEFLKRAQALSASNEDRPENKEPGDADC